MATPIRCRLALLAAASLVSATAGAQTYLGPTPYLSKADSPLLLADPALDDLEDGVLDLLGVSTNHGAVYGPAGNCDSVDADDGVIDGSGTAGHSFFYISGPTGITFTFDANAIGGYPTSAGVVFTDAGSGASISFEAFGANGQSFGTFGPFQIADNSNNGTTAEDRFFGIAREDGISAIKMWASGGGIEVDHIQYCFGALCFEASDTQLAANDPITLTLTRGQATRLGLLVVLGVNGAPYFVPVLPAIFDAAGRITVNGHVPSGLAGLVIDLGGVGFAASGNVEFSNEVALTFN